MFWQRDMLRGWSNEPERWWSFRVFTAVVEIQSTPHSRTLRAPVKECENPTWRMFLSIVRSLLLLSARLESGGGGTAFPDSIVCLWTTAVLYLQRQMLSVLPLWFQLQSKQETQRLRNRAPAWTSQTCTTTVPLKCTTALSPGKWKVNLFIDAHRAALACIHLTRNDKTPLYLSVNLHFQQEQLSALRKTTYECVLQIRKWNYCKNKWWHSWFPMKK